MALVHDHRVSWIPNFGQAGWRRLQPGLPLLLLSWERQRRASGCAASHAQDLLEEYIAQHIAASPDEVIRFSWHGGEPLLFGLDYFRFIMEVQRRYRPVGRKIANGVQTNGTSAR